MKTVRVIPCLDVDDGRVVKGVNFVGLRDAGDPVELAAAYDRQGADEIVFLDITASAHDRDTIIELARHTAEEVFIPFTIGGGIRTVDDARALLRGGALTRCRCNSAAVARPKLGARDCRRVRQPVRRGGSGRQVEPCPMQTALPRMRPPRRAARRGMSTSKGGREDTWYRRAGMGTSR